VADRLEVLAAHLEAENRHDLAAIMATYVDDPVVVINGVAVRGRAGVEKFHARFGFGGAGSFADVRVDERARHVTRDAIAIEQTLSGHHVGDWDGLAPTQRRFSIAVCTVYRFAPSGLLESEDVYFDRAGIRAQLAG
jgi:hypothetical protein